MAKSMIAEITYLDVRISIEVLGWWSRLWNHLQSFGFCCHIRRWNLYEGIRDLLVGLIWNLKWKLKIELVDGSHGRNVQLTLGKSRSVSWKERYWDLQGEYKGLFKSWNDAIVGKDLNEGSTGPLTLGEKINLENILLIYLIYITLPCIFLSLIQIMCIL